MSNEPVQLRSINTDAQYFQPAGTWALESPKNRRSVVGKGEQIAWAEDEVTLLCADTGGWKSTLSQNIARAGIELIPDILGMEVRKFKHILYLAADRPAQAQSSLQRMVNEYNQSIWDHKMYVYPRRLDFALNLEPQRLLTWVLDSPQYLENQEPFDCLIIDSLKDVVTEMDDNTSGIAINAALQRVCQSHIQVLVNIHPRKMPIFKDGGYKAPILDDVAGNKNIVNGAGSVLFIGPKLNDCALVHHTKTPAEELTDLYVLHERATGNLSLGSSLNRVVL